MQTTKHTETKVTTRINITVEEIEMLLKEQIGLPNATFNFIVKQNELVEVELTTVDIKTKEE